MGAGLLLTPSAAGYGHTCRTYNMFALFLLLGSVGGTTRACMIHTICFVPDARISVLASEIMGGHDMCVRG